MRPMHILIALVILAALSLTGCGTSEKARFYTLSAMQAPVRKAPLDISVKIAMVNMAGYIDRPQIVTRMSPNEVSINEFDRWAEPLNNAIPRLVAENLSLLLGSPKVATITSWQGMVAPDYTVNFEVIRFDGNVGGDISLSYMYTILDKQGKKLFEAKRSVLTEPTGGPGYEAMVAAGSRAIAAMSREIAEALRSIHAKQT